MRCVPLALFAVAVPALGAVALSVQQAVPEAPSIWREVAGVIDLGTLNAPDPVFTRPHMPAWRTTSDGRVGIRVEQPQVAGPEPLLRIGLMKPEMLQEPLLTSSVTWGTAHDPTMYDPVLVNGVQADGVTPIDWDGDGVAGGEWQPTHACLWDDGEITAESGKDVYGIKVVVTARRFDTFGTPVDGIRVCTTPIEVVVANPKTPSAVIESVTQSGAQTTSPIWTGPTPGAPGTPRAFSGFGFEPAVAYEGRLLVVRVNALNFTWHDPNTGAPNTGEQYVDIVYSWSEVTGDPANAANWTEVIPITFAPYDARINTTVGFALAPFRDSKGVELLDLGSSQIAFDSAGTYPWIDRDGDNLFMETIFDTLSRKDAGGQYTLYKTAQGRYFYEEVAVPGLGYDPLAVEAVENQWRHQGIAVIGKWTHGKLVQLDNLNNDIDYAVGSDGVLSISPPNLGPQRRIVSLYQPGTVPATTTPPPSLPSIVSDPDAGKILFGYGRSVVRMPLGENDNANIIDSIENKLNYRQHALTTAYRDIVWHVNNSKQTDQHVFDDSLDPDAIIVARMTGTLQFNLPTFTGSIPNFPPSFQHRTGWSAASQSFSGQAQVENAATALPSRWTLPTHGRVIGAGRIEPAALGGVHGKGFWMNGSIGLEFTIPPQTGSESLTGKDWYAGLFVDCRFADDGAQRRLLAFPNGAEVRLFGRRQVLLVEPGGAIAHRATVPDPLGTSSPMNDLLPEGGWAHVALQIREGGRDVEVLLNGLPLSRWSSNDEPLFEVAVGDLVVGADDGQNDGFRGWIDDFKLVAHALDPETAANHAGGTLIGLGAAYAGPWKTELAARFPDWAHESISAVLDGRGEEGFPSYASFYDYRIDNGNDPQSLAAEEAAHPGELVHVRSRIHFPEGPLYHDAPRPFSGDNAFCLSCHHSGAETGLGLGALSYAPGVDATDDPRRQPSQPPARIHGVIPAGLVDSTGLPAAPTTAPAGGLPIDAWLMPSWPGNANVVNFTVLDAATHAELLVLDSAPAGRSQAAVQLDPAVLGTADVIVRTNLDSAQRKVNVGFMSFDGGIGLLKVPVDLDAPYHYGLDLGSLAGTYTHRITATPLGGPARKMTFQVPSAAAGARVIASYQSGFQASSPRRGWLYGWNAYGPVDRVPSFRSLNWSQAHTRYVDSGLAFPEPSGNLSWGSLVSIGGHPGKGTGDGSAVDRFVMAGYRARYPGEYSLAGTVVVPNPSSNGVELGVFHQSGDTMTAIQVPAGTGSVGHAFGPFPSVTLAKGDVLWVAVGPNGSDAHDAFVLDFDVLYDESSF